MVILVAVGREMMKEHFESFVMPINAIDDECGRFILDVP
jgi:hypothetical protein